MEQELLQFIGIFIVGVVCGVIIMLVLNKLTSGTASPKGLKQEYDDYQEKVESHFEETSKKFQDMTEQYQDLYKHLSVGATSLCRPDSVAAGLADQSAETVKLEKKGDAVVESASEPTVESDPSQGEVVSNAEELVASENAPEADKAPESQVELDSSSVKTEEKSA